MSEEFVFEAEHLTVGYPGRLVLHDLSFSVRPGELVGIIGANGAGKSTLMKTLRGMLAAQEGSVRLYGRKIRDIPGRELARLAGYLQQQTAVPFAYTVRDIVMTGRYPYLSWWQQAGERDRQLAGACLAYVGMADQADRPLQELSGGQRQRVLLAKVLAQQTPVLLLDEPAAGLDLMYQEELFRFCRSLCAAGRTVMLIAHELSLAARFCSRLLLIGQGGLIADGAPRKVMTEPLLSRAFLADIRVSVNPLTGHADIYTQPGQPAADREKLLRQITGREGSDGRA